MTRFIQQYFGRFWLAAVYLFLYIPLFFLILFSFNSTRQDGVFTGFSLRWYTALMGDSRLVEGFFLSLKVAVITGTLSTILGAFALAAASIRLVMPLVAAHLREWKVLVTAMLVTALLFAAYPFMGSALAMGACSVLLGFALGTVQPMVMSMLHQITPEARHGEALGLRLMVM